jgi:hypothetical protein
MPRYSNATDSSARKLDVYKKNQHNKLTIDTDLLSDADSDAESCGIDMDSL